ncbi:MAG: TIGR04053 family radical SAM/SPASM domain-containing protein, partial [Terracidiphilus sp.]
MQPMHTIPARGALNFDETPFLVIWEVTQSCDLTCKHCRAAAQPIPHPDELTTAEGKALIDQIAAMGVPIFVFTGGDPMKRADVFELIRYAAGKGVQVALTPSATPLLTREAIFKLKEAGLVRLGISLDGSTAAINDSFRGLPGAYARTVQAIEWANEAGIPIQVHTTISRHNAADLDSLCALFERLAIVMWNVFFLVPVGRGQLDDLLTGDEFEQVFAKIYELSQRVNFQIKTTEAMHYRRYLLQHNLEERRISHGHPVKSAGFSPNIAPAESARASAPAGNSKENSPQTLAYEAGTPTADAQTRTQSWATRRVNDGKGFLFVSHVGNVYPSGFLPIHAGNIRQTPLSEIYRNAPIFKSLRDTSKLEGKCGVCEYKEICGGSRARAYSLTGDPLASEPCCIYHPSNWDEQLE